MAMVDHVLPAFYNESIFKLGGNWTDVGVSLANILEPVFLNRGRDALGLRA